MQLKGGRWNPFHFHLVDSMSEHDAHAHVEVPLEMTVERPGAGVVQLEPDGGR
jgi:hypothetical protein